MDKLIIQNSDQPRDEDNQILGRLITEYNLSQRPNPKRPRKVSQFSSLLKSETGETIGGLWAAVYSDWMFVEYLFVPDELRGQNAGSKLMQAAEAHARSLDLVGMWLDTYSFQARPFYERNGFEVFGQLDNCPDGGVLYFMRKYL